MTGIDQSDLIQVSLIHQQDNTEATNRLVYLIKPENTAIGQAWYRALCEIVEENIVPDKKFMMLGWPFGQRDLTVITKELNTAVININRANTQWHGLPPYVIEDFYMPESFQFSYSEYHNTPLYLVPKHEALNKLHRHFEILQGTVEKPSKYFQAASAETRAAIGQLNTLCHEAESLILSRRKHHENRRLIRPSQITSFPGCRRYELTDSMRQGFAVNGYDREFGTVYLHWSQIGKTLMEVFRDENAPQLTESVCTEIQSLRYYTGEFDVEWGDTIKRNNNQAWHDQEQENFKLWMLANNLDYDPVKFSLGYLPVGRVLLEESFITTDSHRIRNILANYLTLESIEIKGRAIARY